MAPMNERVEETTVLQPPPGLVDARVDEAPPARSRAALGAALHDLERMKVLCPRWPLGFLREGRSKEWWYTGVYDRGSRVYVSWYFVRTNLIDNLIMTVFDPALDDDALPRVKRFCRLDAGAAGEEREGLSLRGRARNLEVSYRLEAPGRWAFALESDVLSAKLQIEQTIPAFTKFDNAMANRYAILHYFQNRANGEIAVRGGKKYPVSNALTYQDHCYGRVPRRTGWHWIAVQNERIALSVLINYGPDAQRFAQVWLGPEVTSPRRREWIRLEQDVSFECVDFDDTGEVWRVTSTELEVWLYPKGRKTDDTKVPPVIGGLVNLTHTEAFVTAEGRVRVDGHWVATDQMFGVFEQHRGRW